MKRRLPKYFVRLMIISLFAGLIPIIAFGIYSNYYFAGNVQRKVDELNVQNLSETVLRLEHLLKTIDYSLTLVANSPELRNAYDAGYDSKHFQTFQALSAQLLRLQSVNMGIKNVYFVHLNKQWVNENRGVIELNWHQWRNVFADLLERESASGWIAASASVKEPGAMGRPEEAGLSIFLYKKTPVNAPKPKGLLVVQLPYAELNQRINLSGVKPAQLILDQELTVIAGASSALPGQNQLPAELKPEIEAAIKATGTAIVKLDRNQEAIIKQSEYNGWYYMAVHPSSQITYEATQIRKVTILLSLLLILTTFLISLYLNRGAYRPIRRLYDTLSSYAGNDRNIDDELEFIGERLESLIDASGSMKKQMVGQVQKLRELYLFKLLLGEVDAADAERQLAYYGIEASANKLAILVAQVSNWGQSRYALRDIDIMMFAVNNVIGELIPPEERMEPLIIGSHQVIIIREAGADVRDRAAFRTYIATIANRLQTEMKRYLDLNLHIGVSRTHEKISDLPRAYSEASEALKNRNVLDAEALLFHEDLFAESNEVFVSPRKAEKDLVVAVHESNAAKAKEALRTIFRELRERNINFKECQLYAARLLVTLIAESLQPGESMQMLSRNNQSVFEQLFELGTVDDIESWFDLDIIRPLVDKRMGDMQQQPSAYIVEQMIAIIQTQYHTDLTLDACAEQLCFSPDYLRRVFRKGIGINFSDYLAQYRFDVSKELLRQTELSIGDIARQLNYNNAQNFIRSFKRVEGITPGQYREQIKS